jgi:aconitate hydratase A / 2-methylisocitrate dehydratase
MTVPTPHQAPLASLVAPLAGTGGRIKYVSLERAEAQGLVAASRLPLTLKILVEGALRHAEAPRDLAGLAERPRRGGLEFQPARLLLQDFTGIPLMTDMASLRDEIARRGGDPAKANPRIPIDFVCDHALIAVHGGRPDARALNEEIEIARNRERFEFLKWCAGAFANIRLIPPGSGIMHQLNLEWLSTVVFVEDAAGMMLARPDTLLGTDSHTPMVGGLGVLGWGVGGIEAQAAMLGHRALLNAPRVVGLRLKGERPGGVTATDLVLHVAEFLRRSDVVNAFVEVFGEAAGTLSIETRATIANMAPEYGATSVYFPIDRKSLDYLRLTGRTDDHIALVEAYAKAQGLWEGPGSNTGGDIYDAVLEFDLSSVEPSLAGPKRPEQRTPLSKVRDSFAKTFPKSSPADSESTSPKSTAIKSGDVVIAAITSCTNTANPSVMLGAGLLARNAVARGLRVKPWVKTSLAPGSRVVGDYLAAVGLQGDLDALGFHIIGYGCTTCNGNSGPLADAIARDITENDVAAVAVLSGNRNFAGRIHPLVPAAYLASPALVVAFAIAGTVLIDLARQPLGTGTDGNPVMLADIWPGDAEIASLLSLVSPDGYRKAYQEGALGHASWAEISAREGTQFPWRSDSTFITPSPLDMPPAFDADTDVIDEMRPLAILGDGITTDTLSPNGAILAGTPAARFLAARGVAPTDFGNYAARRGSHEVAVRGMFANPHIENEMLAGKRGPATLLMPEGEELAIFDAGMAYVARGTPAIIIAGKGYGSGSSRDWAAKGLRHLGVQAVVAESYERIHRANLVGVGILPLTFPRGANRKTLGLTGRERFRLRGLRRGLAVGGELDLDIMRENGGVDTVVVEVSLETDKEREVLRRGGLLPMLLHELTAG